MAGSNWNALLERLLAEKLTPNEYRAALAIARLTLGYRKTGRGLGRKWICETAGGMDGRSFDRARAGLVKKGLLRYEPGSIGKGHRGHYELVLDPSQKAHSDAPFEEAVKGAPRRAKSGTSKRRAGDTQKAHSDAPRIGKGKKNPSATPELQQLVADAIDAYRDHGGNLELADRKPALIGQVTQLARNGHDRTTILAAASALGRERAFPGYLRQRVEQLEAQGGPCAWRDFDRSQLSPERLRECGCTKCEEWATAKVAA
jgi:hypothetical protein